MDFSVSMQDTIVFILQLKKQNQTQNLTEKRVHHSHSVKTGTKRNSAVLGEEDK